MPASTITSKGRVTLPKEIRDRLGVGPGDCVRFRATADGSVVVEPENVDLRTLRGILKPRVRRVTIKAMDEAIRKSASRRR